MKSPCTTAFALIASSSSARSLTRILRPLGALSSGNARKAIPEKVTSLVLEPSGRSVLDAELRPRPRERTVGPWIAARCSLTQATCSRMVPWLCTGRAAASRSPGTTRDSCSCCPAWPGNGLACRCCAATGTRRPWTAAAPPSRTRWPTCPGIKLRVAKIRPGRREGVETEIHRDLTTLARNNAISDALVVSAEEDLAQVIADVQDLGMRVTLVHIAVDGNWTISRALRQESDDIIEIGGDHLRPYVELIVGCRARAVARARTPTGPVAARPLANGHSTARAASYQPLPAAPANHAPPAIYTAPVVAEYQRPALQLPSAAGPRGPDPRRPAPRGAAPRGAAP